VFYLNFFRTVNLRWRANNRRFHIFFWPMPLTDLSSKQLYFSCSVWEGKRPFAHASRFLLVPFVQLTPYLSFSKHLLHIINTNWEGRITSVFVLFIKLKNLLFSSSSHGPSCVFLCCSAETFVSTRQILEPNKSWNFVRSILCQFLPSTWLDRQ
jgi:hypothetical protein